MKSKRRPRLRYRRYLTRSGSGEDHKPQRVDVRVTRLDDLHRYLERCRVVFRAPETVEDNGLCRSGHAGRLLFVQPMTRFKHLTVGGVGPFRRQVQMDTAG